LRPQCWVTAAGNRCTSGGVDCWDGGLGERAATGIDQGLILRTSKLAAVGGSVVVVVVRVGRVWPGEKNETPSYSIVQYGTKAHLGLAVGEHEGSLRSGSG
jgi:hypothetical protein